MLKGDAKAVYGSLVNSVHVSFFPNGSVKLNCYSSFEISVLEGFHLSS